MSVASFCLNLLVTSFMKTQLYFKISSIVRKKNMPYRCYSPDDGANKSIFIEQEGVWMIKHKQIREMTEVLTGCQIGKSVDDE